MTLEPDGHDDVPGDGAIALLLRRTLVAVGDGTTVEPRPIHELGPAAPMARDRRAEDPPSVPAGPDPARRGRRPWRLLVAAAAALAVLLGGLAVRRDDHTTTLAGVPPTTAPTSTATTVPSGPRAWLLPPRRSAGLELGFVQAGRSFGSAGIDPATAPVTTPRGVVHHIGTLSFVTNRLAEDVRTVAYRFEDPAAPRDLTTDPPLRITTATSTQIDLDAVRLGPATLTPARVGDFSVVDAGEICAPDGQRQLVSSLLVTMTPCRHLYLVGGGDLTIVIDTDPGRELADLVANLRIVSGDELQAALAGVSGLDHVLRLATAPVPTTPPPTEVSIPDTVLCQSWANVLRHASEGGELSANAAMFEDMQAMAAAAPPELAADLELLTRMWSQNPVPPESAEVMGRVMAGGQAACGFWNLQPG